MHRKGCTRDVWGFSLHTLASPGSHALNVVIILRGFAVSEYAVPGDTVIVSEKDPEDSGDAIQAYLMLLQLEELEFMPLSTESISGFASLLHSGMFKLCRK
jgi:hypothetical protein